MSFPWNITNPGIILTGLLTSEEKQFVVDLFELSYANGDILYYNTGQLQRLPIGTEGHYLKIISGLPAWAVGGGGGGSVSDAVYGVGWNGDTTNAPSKNAIYDKIETLGNSVDGGSSDDVYTAAQVVDGGTA